MWSKPPFFCARPPLAPMRCQRTCLCRADAARRIKIICRARRFFEQKCGRSVSFLCIYFNDANVYHDDASIYFPDASIYAFRVYIYASDVSIYVSDAGIYASAISIYSFNFTIYAFDMSIYDSDTYIYLHKITHRLRKCNF